MKEKIIFRELDFGSDILIISADRVLFELFLENLATMRSVGRETIISWLDLVYSLDVVLANLDN